MLVGGCCTACTTACRLIGTHGTGCMIQHTAPRPRLCSSTHTPNTRVSHSLTTSLARAAVKGALVAAAAGVVWRSAGWYWPQQVQNAGVATCSSGARPVEEWLGHGSHSFVFLLDCCTAAVGWLCLWYCTQWPVRRMGFRGVYGQPGQDWDHSRGLCTLPSLLCRCQHFASQGTGAYMPQLQLKASAPTLGQTAYATNTIWLTWADVCMPGQWSRSKQGRLRSASLASCSSMSPGCQHTGCRQ